METKKLTEREQEETNGGSILGGGNDQSSASGSSLNLGVDNLLSSENSSTDGDESNSSSFSVGNGIGTSLDKATRSSSN